VSLSDELVVVVLLVLDDELQPLALFEGVTFKLTVRTNRVGFTECRREAVTEDVTLRVFEVLSRESLACATDFHCLSLPMRDVKQFNLFVYR